MGELDQWVLERYAVTSAAAVRGKTEWSFLRFLKIKITSEQIRNVLISGCFHNHSETVMTSFPNFSNNLKQ